MSYRSDGDPRVNKVLSSIYELVEALKETGDPIFNEKFHPNCIEWMNEEFALLGLKVVKKERSFLDLTNEELLTSLSAKAYEEEKKKIPSLKERDKVRRRARNVLRARKVVKKNGPRKS